MLKKQLLLIVFTLSVLISIAQVKISGTVYDEYLEPFYNAKVTNGNKVTTSNDDGKFTILSDGKFPQKIKVSAFGYKTELVVVNSEKNVNIVLKENIILDQVVISASRVPERIIESPVTVERFGISDVKSNTSKSFYDGLTNLKGVDSREGNYGYKSINTRGFADFSNSRFVQLVDGMDTAAPALNFSAGNLSGVSELDIQSVEILPGASSALYGANAYNGIMLLNTKNPFDFTGINTMFKTGVTNQEIAGSNFFYDLGVRMAYKFSDAFAAKVNLTYFEAEEWHAADYRNKLVDSNELTEGTYDSTPNYDGVNTYGDEVFLFDLSSFDSNFPFASLLRRTGYQERELLRDHKTRNLKFSSSLHYRPFKNEDLELMFTTRIGMGDNIFQGTSRYAQRNYYIAQNKLEIKGENFYIRGYHTKNDAGDSYDLTRTGIGINNEYASNSVWIDDFFDKWFFDLEPYAAARSYADRNRLKYGTKEFKEAFNKVTSTLITEGGSAIYDKSSYVHADGNYNFKSLLNDWADVQVGGSYREYNPDSKGTIFNDGKEAISIEEYGLYTQFQKKFFNERLKLTTSLRYDKSQNFKGNYSPRVALNYALGKEKGHILRASYQTGFRNPTVQEQYLFLSTAIKTNVGSTGDNLRRIELENVNDFGSLGVFLSTTTGDDIINNSLLTRSVYDDTFQGGDYIKSDYKEIQPEVVRTFELGYRSILRLNNKTNLDIDVSAFYSDHDNFVFFQDLVVPNYGLVYPNGTRKLTAAELADPNNQFALIIDDVMVLDSDANLAFDEGHVREFNLVTNSKSKVTSYGFAFGMHTKLFKNFDFGLNYNFTDFEYEDLDYGSFEPNFNTPKHMVKAQFGNNKLFKNFGFNLNARWLDKYRWVSPFVKGAVDSRTVFDAQFNYRIPSMKSTFKIGGTNLFGKDYYVAPGSGQIGQLYYLSWIINN